MSVKIKFDFDPKKIEREIKKQIEKNPQAILRGNAGNELDAACPNCGQHGLRITNQGTAVCTNPSCMANIKVNFNVK